MNTQVDFAGSVEMSSVKDAWVVLLNELIVHAGNFGANNVMEYKDKELEAFETGLGMMIIYMKNMMKDILEEKKDE
jgi:hypothetical protein|tara:strand:+ start:954 stop:1181 length:228 start_codon:yes stop_codon:yes gene_type:complete